MLEPILLCRCGKSYYECWARRAPAGHLTGPCGHPLTRAWYADPRTRRRLVAYARVA